MSRFGKIIAGVGKVATGAIAVGGLVFAYLQWDVGRSSLDLQRDQMKQQAAAERRSATEQATKPEQTKEKAPLPPTAPSPQTAEQPRTESPISNNLRQAALASRPAGLGNVLRPAPAEAPAQGRQNEASSNSTPVARIITAIEGEPFGLCGETDFVVSLWSVQPNAPSRASIRRSGGMVLGAASTMLKKGETKELGNKCSVRFVEVRSGFKPIVVLEERRS